jgi:hypothetical protein
VIAELDSSDGANRQAQLWHRLVPEDEKLRLDELDDLEADRKAGACPGLDHVEVKATADPEVDDDRLGRGVEAMGPPTTWPLERGRSTP